MPAPLNTSDSKFLNVIKNATRSISPKNTGSWQMLNFETNDRSQINLTNKNSSLKYDKMQQNAKKVI